MGPSKRHVCVPVYSTRVLSHDTTSILQEAGGFQPVDWFLDSRFASVLNEKHTARGEPPAKRQRTSKATKRVPEIETDDADQIPLSLSIVDLYFPDTLTAKPPSADTISQHTDLAGADEVGVRIREVEELGGGGAKLALGLDIKAGAVVELQLEGMDDDTLQELQHIKSHEKLGTPNATVTRCTLALSKGAQHRIVRFSASLSWRSGVPYFPHDGSRKVGKAQQAVDFKCLTRYYPDRSRMQAGIDYSIPWSPQDFYESVHMPSKSFGVPQEFEKSILETDLFPFQKRAVKWMLEREGVAFKDGQLVALPHQRGSLFDEESTDADGKPCYVSHLEGTVRSHPTDAIQLHGGLLAEEMGLGKTVELMALIKSHERPDIGTSRRIRDTISQTDVLPSRATLIVTPPSILKQWESELSRHAPAFSVLHYEGVVSAGKKSPKEKQLLQDLANEYDVVLATYQTLANELHFAEDPPDRNMRHSRKYERKRSPLIQIQWWRICLDEAQMVESGVTAAARVACRLPRVNSWAVTGTPLRKDVQDLLGLLIFLRYKPFSESAKLWTHLTQNHRHKFKTIFGKIALRHTKASIREELRLPPQKRVVITVPFSAIEQNNYTTLFNDMCEDVGLRTDGSPLRDDWDPDDSGTVEKMRNWLVRLRQTCLHPQVGGRNRKALGRGQGPLRTVAEVLEVMIEQNEASTRVEERALLSTQLIHAHVLGNAKEDEHRSEKALEIYTAALETSAVLVKDARARLAGAKANKETVDAAAETDDEDSSTESNPLMGGLRNNLRTALQLQHVCTFFAATAYYQVKENENITLKDSDRFRELEQKEMALYEKAKIVRKEVLLDVSSKAERLMRRIQEASNSAMLTTMPKIKDLESFGGIESRKVVEKSDDVFDTIRKQHKLITEWRSKIVEFLLKPLVDEDEGVETTGDEYEDSTKQQDELYVYFDALKAVSADLNTFVTGESAPLIDHEMKSLIRDAKRALDPEVPDDEKPNVHAPALTLKLLAHRNSLRSRVGEVGSVRALIQETRSLQSAMEWQAGSSRANAELAIVQRQLPALQAVLSAQTKALAGLEKEVDLYRSTQNQRLEFYRQLQELSDAVAPYKEDLDQVLDLIALQNTMAKEETQSKVLAALKTKHRFLLNLREESTGQAGAKICVICQCNFERGVLTVCGHQYCKECIGHWWTAHRTCPVCKRRLATVDFHDITYKPQELRAQEEVASGSTSPGERLASASPQSSSIYSDVDSGLMNEIKSIDLPGSYGTKIDTLSRHLLWIRENDPGAKSIVFSQYREFLDVLGSAFTEFRVGYSRLGRSGAVERFRNDASVDCLLLDAKTDSSGLTLVNATHVFICEPLIQTAVELQAIARVHRIGQTRATTVWMYLISDTVEEAIYEISVARRLAHLQSRQDKRTGKSRSGTPALGENALDAANSEELQQAPISKLLVSGKGSGELVGKEDLWQCLFKARKVVSKVSMDMEAVVGRHLRAEAAEGRRAEESSA